MIRIRSRFYLAAAVLSFVLLPGCRSRTILPESSPSAPLALPKPELIAAVLKGDTATVQRLLDRGADIEARNPADGRTSLMLAAVQRNREMVKLLLRRGAKTEARDDVGMTALMWGAFGGSPEIVQALLAEGAKINAVSQSGETALDWGRDHPKIVAILQKAAPKK